MQFLTFATEFVAIAGAAYTVASMVRHATTWQSQPTEIPDLGEELSDDSLLGAIAHHTEPAERPEPESLDEILEDISLESLETEEARLPQLSADQEVVGDAIAASCLELEAEVEELPEVPEPQVSTVAESINGMRGLWGNGIKLSRTVAHPAGLQNRA
ncbi:MAG: hypothetical protein F6K19_13210 [Cyanothece sp. SIO1E1]|nr:hypothetical protein [Cyanothece sp. SIO1E1]